jgi:hypothetical protein
MLICVAMPIIPLRIFSILLSISVPAQAGVYDRYFHLNPFWPDSLVRHCTSLLQSTARFLGHQTAQATWEEMMTAGQKTIRAQNKGAHGHHEKKMPTQNLIRSPKTKTNIFGDLALEHLMQAREEFQDFLRGGVDEDSRREAIIALDLLDRRIELTRQQLHQQTSKWGAANKKNTSVRQGNMELRTQVIDAFSSKYYDLASKMSYPQKLFLMAGMLKETDRLQLDIPEDIQNAMIMNNEWSNFVTSLEFLALDWLLEIESKSALAIAALQMGNESVVTNGKFEGKISETAEQAVRSRLGRLSKDDQRKILGISGRIGTEDLQIIKDRLDKLARLKNKQPFRYYHSLTERKKRLSAALYKIETMLGELIP